MTTRFLTWALSQAWALHRPVAESAVRVLMARARGERVPRDQVISVVGARDDRRRAVLADRKVAIFDDDDDEPKRSYGPPPPPPPRGMTRHPDQEPGWYLDGSVGVVPVDGIICKYADQVNGSSQPAGITPADLQDAVLKAAQSSRTKAVVLDIDSPGGTVAGGEDVVEAIDAAKGIRSVNNNTAKPIIAYAHDLCCSGAMLLASQCDEIYASANAMVGSIGVYQAIWDDSEALADRGVHVRVIASGPYKGAGTDGAPLTDAHMQKFQQEVNDLAGWLVSRVAMGRGMDPKKVQQLATGEVWIGQQAVDVGLVDGVMGFRELIGKLNAEL